MQFTARYVFSVEDYATLLDAVRSQRPYAHWLIRLMFIGLILALWVIPSFSTNEPDHWTSVWEFVAGLVPLAIIYLAWELLMVRSFLSSRLSYKQCALAGLALSYELGEKGVTWTREHMQGEFAWPAVGGIAWGKGSVVLLFGKRQGVVLPVRAFASQGEFEAASNFIRAKVGARREAAGA
jgi:hypothetical protein